jgi:hypothetical protein
MAKRTVTTLIDDIDGSEAAETVKFALDGVAFEIDLSQKNASKLRNVLAPYIEKGTKVTGRGAATAGRSTGRARGAVAEREQNKAIRAWAIRRGLDVAPRGRIKADIVEQYHREAGR